MNYNTKYNSLVHLFKLNKNNLSYYENYKLCNNKHFNTLILLVLLFQ